MWLTKLSPPDPETALKELKSDLWLLQNNTKSALAHFPYDNKLKAFAVKIGVKP
jgi:hypothetical protein